jgi:hypothetical protein
MTVVHRHTDDEKMHLVAMALCSDAEMEGESAIGEPTECALVNDAYKEGMSKDVLKGEYPRVGEAPFDSGRKMMSTVHTDPQGGFVQFTKGAPDEVLKRCTKAVVNGAVVEMTDEIRDSILAANKAMADQALRVLCSAYRSVDYQEKVFGDSMKKRVKEGLGYWDAYLETSKNVAIPGTSEHGLGLALDLISNDYEELDEKQQETPEAKWLAENCYKYGFILRYPPEKTHITGINYEPWHYRYVGEEHAKKIMDLGITLEEYLQDYYTPQEGEK